MKSVVTHLGLLAVAGALAFSVWSREEKAERTKSETIEVWSGRADAVESVEFESKKRKVRVQPKSDAQGRYYVVRLDKEDEPPAPKPADSSTPPLPPPVKRESQLFIGTKEAEQFIEKVAALKAVRAIGKVEAARNAEFGFDKPEGTIKVKVAGKEHVLTIGGQTPGGTERYAKAAPSNEVFAIESDLVQSLNFADSRLLSHNLQGFEDEEVKRVRISKAVKSRELVRMPEKKEAWADAATPTKADETALNWMTKLGRLRAINFVEKPTGNLEPIAMVEYLAGTRPLGKLELYKTTGEKGPEYLARTAYTRWYVTVPTSAAEQVDQDLGALLK
ncbi:MAG TPA: DUF4340 domain-containing protein [Polyangiaceae bacterium]|nr:DUF4340 domain-containing protein [Polyangiaceae bacterium]